MPELLNLALRNVLRHRGRTAMILSSIIFGVVALILAGGFIKDTVDELAESLIHSQTGHLQVSRLGYREQGISEGFGNLLASPEQLRQSLAAQPGVEDVLLRLEFSGLLNNGSNDWAIMGEGVEPEAEARLGSYINISAGRQLSADDPYGIMLGAGVGKALSLVPGDWINLRVSAMGGATNVLEFQVVGIFQTFSKDYDARAVRIPLLAAQQLMGSQGAHLAVITLVETSTTSQAAAAIAIAQQEHGYEVFDWMSLNPFYQQTVDLYLRQFGFLVVVILLMVILSVSNAINMNVHERSAEFGTMKVCGAPPREIFRLLLLENMILGLAGAMAGLVLGNVLALVISVIGIPMPPPPNSDLGYIALIRVGWVASLVAAAMGLLAPILASLLPAKRASKADIAESLRHAI